MVINFCFFKLAITHTQQEVISKECLHTQKCFPVIPGFSGVHSEKSCIDSRRIGTQMYIEDATPFPWPIKCLDLREKQYLTLRSLSLKDCCLLNKATMVSSKQFIDQLTTCLGKIYTILQNKRRRWLGAAPPPIIFEP